MKSSRFRDSIIRENFDLQHVFPHQVTIGDVLDLTPTTRNNEFRIGDTLDLTPTTRNNEFRIGDTLDLTPTTLTGKFRIAKILDLTPRIQQVIKNRIDESMRKQSVSPKSPKSINFSSATNPMRAAVQAKNSLTIEHDKETVVGHFNPLIYKRTPNTVSTMLTSATEIPSGVADKNNGHEITNSKIDNIETTSLRHPMSQPIYQNEQHGTSFDENVFSARDGSFWVFDESQNRYARFEENTFMKKLKLLKEEFENLEQNKPRDRYRTARNSSDSSNNRRGMRPCDSTSSSIFPVLNANRCKACISSP
jgi:hypothetical protein